MTEYPVWSIVTSTMAGHKEIEPPFPSLHEPMSDYEWNLRFNRYALQYREFNTKKGSLLDLIFPSNDIKNQPQNPPLLGETQSEL